jgi:putative sporulation protein YyaC
LSDLKLSDESLGTLINLKMSMIPKVFMCIGTPKHIWDSYGPMVGSMIKTEFPNVISYGTMDEPLTSDNVEDVEDLVRRLYPKHMLIAIDGSVTSDRNKANLIWIRQGGFRPGAAYNKGIKVIGDFSIVYGIHLTEFELKDNTKPFKAALETMQVIRKLLI